MLMMRIITRSPANQAKANITFIESVNVYAYNASNLWRAYGAGLALLVGLMSFATQRHSARTTFAELLRRSRNLPLDENVYRAYLPSAAFGNLQLRLDADLWRVNSSPKYSQPDEHVESNHD